jgi:hypothetical protein
MKLCNTLSKYTQKKNLSSLQTIGSLLFQSLQKFVMDKGPWSRVIRDLQVHVKLVKHLVWAPSPKLNTSELVQKHDFTEMIDIHIHNFTAHKPNFTQNCPQKIEREKDTQRYDSNDSQAPNNYNPPLIPIL